MLELIGSYYVIEHVLAENQNRCEDKIYRLYTSDLLKAIVEQWGTSVNYSYSDLIEPVAKQEEQNGDEIALDVIKKAGLRVN